MATEPSEAAPDGSGASLLLLDESDVLEAMDVDSDPDADEAELDERDLIPT